MKKINYILAIILGMLASSRAIAQLNPMGNIYYHNQYLLNPAMAGISPGWELNASYKAQWTGINDAPSMQAFTATYGSEGKRAGFGLLLYNDKAGVVQTTSVKASYAYHLPISSGGSFIDFGLSAGVLDEWVDQSEVIGDQDDAAIGAFNDRKLYLDADFGLALRTNNFTIQGSLPNLKRFWGRDIQRNVADKSLFMTSVAYKFNYEDSKLSSIEPKVMYRVVENYKDIVDAGLNFQFNGDKLMLSGIYHTTQSITFGAGTTYKHQLAILAQYTTNTADLQGYSNGEFEIAVKLSFK